MRDDPESRRDKFSDEALLRAPGWRARCRASRRCSTWPAKYIDGSFSSARHSHAQTASRCEQAIEQHSDPCAGWCEELNNPAHCRPLLTLRCTSTSSARSEFVSTACGVKSLARRRQVIDGCQSRDGREEAHDGEHRNDEIELVDFDSDLAAVNEDGAGAAPSKPWCKERKERVWGAEAGHAKTLRPALLYDARAFRWGGRRTRAGAMVGSSRLNAVL